MSFVIAMLAILAVGAWRDITTRTIPDGVSVALAVMGSLARLLQGSPAFFSSVSTALLLFSLLLIAYSRGLLGGGDVKLMTALALGLSPFDCYLFVVATMLAGGILGITYLMLSRRLDVMRKSRRSSSLMRLLAVEVWRIRRRGPLPYGVAIAGGGAFVFLHTGSF